MQIFKSRLPIAVAFIMGVAMFFQFFIPSTASSMFLEWVTQWVRIIAGISILLGIYSLLHYHYYKIRRKVPGWGFSVVTWIGFFAMSIAGFTWGIQNPDPKTALLADGVTPYQYQVNLPFMWMYSYLFVPMQATMFSILAFYIASAAYRAFRARTPEATVLLITAIIVMLGRVPIGAMMITYLPFHGIDETQTLQFLPWVTEWILNNPSMAAQRGIMMGIGLGMIATSLRIIFGIERAYMGGGD